MFQIFFQKFPIFLIAIFSCELKQPFTQQVKNLLASFSF